jgi:hypothetical protein
MRTTSCGTTNHRDPSSDFLKLAIKPVRQQQIPVSQLQCEELLPDMMSTPVLMKNTKL